MSTKPYKVLAYTAEEVIRILKGARALGVQSIRLEGFSAEFDPQLFGRHDAPAADSREGESRREDRDDRRHPAYFCQDCGERKVESKNGGLFCYPCWQGKKTRRPRGSNGDYRR